MTGSEGLRGQILHEYKNRWESKIAMSSAVNGHVKSCLWLYFLSSSSSQHWVPACGSRAGYTKERFGPFVERKHVDRHVWRVGAVNNECLPPSLYPQQGLLQLFPFHIPFVDYCGHGVPSAEQSSFRAWRPQLSSPVFSQLSLSPSSW